MIYYYSAEKDLMRIKIAVQFISILIAMLW